MSFFVAGPHDDGGVVTGHYHEVAHGDRAQVWAYTDGLSYAPGQKVVLHGMSTARMARVTVARDGVTPLIVLQADVAMGFHPTPSDCSVTGCAWPEVWRFFCAAGLGIGRLHRDHGHRRPFQPAYVRGPGGAAPQPAGHGSDDRNLVRL